MEEIKIGDTVWYLVGQDRQQAEVLDLRGRTHVLIRLLTGAERGRELDAPIGIVAPLREPTK